MAEHEKAAPAPRTRVQELEAENAQLRSQLAASSSGRTVAPAHTFTLTEGARLELEQRGFTTVGGVLYSADEVRAKLKGTDQADVEIAEATDTAKAEADRTLTAVRRDDQGAQYGVTHVYPSVAPGLIDPAVAGTPGISGPPAA